MRLGWIRNFRYNFPRFPKFVVPVVRFRNFEREFVLFSLFRYLRPIRQQILGVCKESSAGGAAGAQEQLVNELPLLGA